MASEWITCQLSDACAAIDYGLTASASKEPSNTKFLRITDIEGGVIDWDSVPFVQANAGTLDKYRLGQGDVVLARTGASTGRSAYIQSPPAAVFASYLVRLKARAEFDSRFIYYYLNSDLFWNFLRGVLGDKSAQPNASASTMTKAPFRAPKDIGEQAAISGVFGFLDDKIASLRGINRTLEAIARAIFKSWFVDFDPVRAKAEGRDPEGMDAATAVLFPAILYETEHRFLPAGWGYETARQLMRQSRDLVNPSRHPEELFAHFSLPAFDEGKTPKIELGRYIKSNKTLVHSGSVLLSKLNPHIPRIWLPDLSDDFRAICSTEFMVMVPNSPFSAEYLFCQFSETGFAQQYGGLTTGTSNSHQRVKPEYLADHLLLKPSCSVVEAFTAAVRPLFDRWKVNIQIQHTLAALRDTLLPRLISGKLRVPEAEKLVETMI